MRRAVGENGVHVGDLALAHGGAAIELRGVENQKLAAAVARKHTAHVRFVFVKIEQHPVWRDSTHAEDADVHLIAVEKPMRFGGNDVQIKIAHAPAWNANFGFGIARQRRIRPVNPTLKLPFP